MRLLVIWSATLKSRYEGIIGYKWEGSPGRIRMPLEQRAKICAPFAALKGYSELLRKTEEEAMQRFEKDKSKYENPDVIVDRTSIL